MSGLTPQDKENLALLYERPEFKSLQKWNDVKRQTFADQVLKVDMSKPGSATQVAFLQGQAYAHELMLLELRKIHKEQSADDNA